MPGIGTIEWEDTDSDFDLEQEDNRDDFAAMLEADSGNQQIREGSIVNAQVVKFTDDAVIVDIGHKAEGEIPRHEFTKFNNTLSVAIGDTIEVYLDRFENDNGEMVLFVGSVKKKAPETKK